MSADGRGSVLFVPCVSPASLGSVLYYQFGSLRQMPPNPSPNSRARSSTREPHRLSTSLTRSALRDGEGEQRNRLAQQGMWAEKMQGGDEREGHEETKRDRDGADDDS